MSKEDGTVVQVAAPCGEIWKLVLATPEPASDSVEPSVIVCRTFAASAPIVEVGGVLSTRIGPTTCWVRLPATSVTLMRKSYVASVTLVVSNAASNAPPPCATPFPTKAHVDVPLGARSKLTEFRPLVASASPVAWSVIYPRTLAAGETSVAAGAVWSTVTCTSEHEA